MRRCSQVTGRFFWGLSICAALALGGCGAQFAPPGRGDLSFAASQVRDGEVELTVSGMPSEAWQGDVRLGVGELQALEFSIFGRGWPGEKHGFALGGVGYRRWLSRDRLRLNVGGGLAVGTGGWNNHLDDSLTHDLPTGAGWVDAGAGWALVDGLTLYAGGRAQVGQSFVADEAVRPPTTLWLSAGFGARADLGPAFGTLGYQFVRYDNELDSNWFHSVGVGVGWRM
ncbi:MAG: hypothetical protein KC502_03730 [Myxococcales bacterium]|nr:hypothetical protein [Myxococcales bacterium]